MKIAIFISSKCRDFDHSVQFLTWREGKMYGDAQFFRNFAKPTFFRTLGQISKLAKVSYFLEN